MIYFCDGNTTTASTPKIPCNKCDPLPPGERPFPKIIVFNIFRVQGDNTPLFPRILCCILANNYVPLIFRASAPLNSSRGTPPSTAHDPAIEADRFLLLELRSPANTYHNKRCKLYISRCLWVSPADMSDMPPLQNRENLYPSIEIPGCLLACLCIPLVFVFYEYAFKYTDQTGAYSETRTLWAPCLIALKGPCIYS